MKSKKSILLTGASGTIGQEILKQLVHLKDEYKITVFDIKNSKSSKIFSSYKNEITVVYGNLTKEKDLLKVCSNKDVVIHMAAIIPPLADEKPELSFKVNALGTENLIKLLEKHSPKAFFIYSSSISVYGDRLKNPWIRISDPLIPSPGDEYAKTKIYAEKVLLKSKLNWTIFRLAAIMGGHKISKLMFHQPLKTSLEIATSADTARAFVNAVEKQNLLSNRIFNLGGGENCRILYDEFLKRSFEIFGLGELNFPNKSFAEKNFHCGFYEDGDELNDILNFRKDTLEDYFLQEKRKVSAVQKFMTSLIKNQIKTGLLKKSEPLHAFKNKDADKMNHYFDFNNGNPCEFHF